VSGCMRPKVFLSFDARDADLAKDLVKQLTEAGVEVVSPTVELRPSGDWLATVESRIRECDEVVVLLTANSLDAPRVVMEMGAAYGMHKRVVPLSLGVDDNPMVKDLPYVRYTDIKRYVEDVRKRVAVAEDTRELRALMLLILQKLKKVRGKAGVSSAQLSKIITSLSMSASPNARTALGLPYLPRFPLYHYGPYSPELGNALQELLEDRYVKVETKHIPRGFRLTDEGHTQASRIAKQLAPDVEETLTRVLEKPLKVQRKPARSKRTRS